MKPFEKIEENSESAEKFTAWIDGELTGKDLVEFEMNLPGNAAAEKADAQKLGALLRQYAAAPELANGDFFNHQLLEKIANSERSTLPAYRSAVSVFKRSPLARFAWIGAACLLVAFVLYSTIIPFGPKKMPTASDYMAQVLSAESGQKGITATAFHSKKANLTVLWLNGMNYIPSEPDIANHP